MEEIKKKLRQLHYEFDLIKNNRPWYEFAGVEIRLQELEEELTKLFQSNENKKA